MLGMGTRASVRLKSEFESVDTIGWHPNSKHLLGSSQGSEDEYDEESYDPEEEAMLRDVEAENQQNMNASDTIEMEHDPRRERLQDSEDGSQSVLVRRWRPTSMSSSANGVIAGTRLFLDPVCTNR